MDIIVSKGVGNTRTTGLRDNEDTQLSQLLHAEMAQQGDTFRLCFRFFMLVYEARGSPLFANSAQHAFSQRIPGPRFDNGQVVVVGLAA